MSIAMSLLHDRMPDDWTTAGAVLDEAALAAVKPIEDESPVIVEHGSTVVAVRRIASSSMTTMSS